MAVSFNKTYSITLKYSYEDARAITDADLNVAILRANIIAWIEEKVGNHSKGDLSAHIVGSVTEA